MFHVFNAFGEKHINGLLFSPSAERINDRTSLILFENKPLKLKDTFRIDFDLAIWDIKQFGYILRIINESKQEINFAFVNFYGEDKIYLDFHSPITHKSVQIPFSAQDIDEKRWLPITIIFDLKADRAEVISKGISYICETIGLKNPSQIKLAFGLHGLNLDVPEMAIRNVRVEEIGGKKYSIPLNEVKGGKVHDDKGNEKGRVKNPNWLINRHFYWEEKTSFKSDPMTGVAYNEETNQVIITEKNTVSTYSMRYNKKEQYVFNDLPETLNQGETIYDDENKLLYIYNLEQEEQGEPTMAIINTKDKSVKYRYAQAGNRLHHHNVFLGGNKNDLYIFGGYGNHSYSNKILKYDAITDQWEQANFLGDEIYPRYFSASGRGMLPSQVLIMGGIGNESGKQEHGGRHLYDLYSLDIQTKQIKKIWEIKDIHAGAIPCSNLILNEEKTHFFTLCYPHHQGNSILQLYKFNISDGSYEIVSDSIHINTEQIETAIYLFYNSQLEEFYTVIKENTLNEQAEIRIYSLLSPPVTVSMLDSRGKLPMYWAFFLLLIPLVGIPVAIYLKRTKQTEEKDAAPVLPEINTERPEEEAKKEKDKKNSVYVFGDFTVFDKSGKDISYRFSSKLRSLFALILFYSIDGEGISTDMLTAELWPDKDVNSAKNTRGVTVNRLRSILVDITGITLFHQNSKWYFSFDSDFYCDYVEYRKIIRTLNEDKTNEDENMSRLFEVLRRGTLFPNLQESWIDSQKHEYEDEIEKKLWSYMLKLNENKKYSKVVEYSDLFFSIDPLNEDALKLSVYALQKTGKKDQAVLLYNKFVSNYKKVLGEEPNLPQLF